VAAEPEVAAEEAEPEVAAEEAADRPATGEWRAP
jgi:hypothetical protein